MFSNKTETKEIQGIEFQFRYPTIADNIKINSKKNQLTRGQYFAMSIANIDTTTITDKIAVLNQCVVCVDKRYPNFLWENLEEDFLSLAEETYEKYLEWKSFFRENKAGASTKQETDKEDSGERISGASVQGKV